ncbi:MAG: hypothetical protein ABIU96_03885 [Rhodanobacter sp.]
MTLALPILPSTALTRIIDPALAMLPAKLGGDAARVLLLAIALQESGLRRRMQPGEDAARGLWPFAQDGVVRKLLMHPSTCDVAAALCACCGVDASAGGVYSCLVADDLLSCGFARLNLYTDAAPLPAPDNSMGAWACYVRVWTPDKPRPRDWVDNYATAMSALGRSAIAA